MGLSYPQRDEFLPSFYQEPDDYKWGKIALLKELGSALITIDIIVSWIAQRSVDELRGRQAPVSPRLIYHKISKGGIKKA